MTAATKARDTDEPAFHDTVIMEHAGVWERGKGVRAEEPTVIFPRVPAQSAPPTDGTVTAGEPDGDEPDAPVESPAEPIETAR